MSDQTDNLEITLERFGLNADEASVYLYLLEKRVATALNISRNLHIGRTKVYRLLDRLIEKRLTVQKLDSAGLKFIATDPSSFEAILSSKESELSNLRSSLPQVIQSLKNKIGPSMPGSQILYYHGKQGLAQVNWNLLRAKGIFYSYEVATADAYMPQKEAEKLRQGIVENKIHIQTIMNKKSINPFTDVTELANSFWEVKYISPQVLNIQTDVFIYNDIYAACHYLDYGDIFCFELQNKQLAEMQKALFENLWKQAQSLTVLNEHGKAALKK